MLLYHENTLKTINSNSISTNSRIGDTFPSSSTTIEKDYLLDYDCLYFIEIQSNIQNLTPLKVSNCCYNGLSNPNIHANHNDNDIMKGLKILKFIWFDILFHFFLPIKILLNLFFLNVFL